MAVLPVSVLPVFNFFYKNNKSEPMTNRYKVRIILFWWTYRNFIQTTQHYGNMSIRSNLTLIIPQNQTMQNTHILKRKS